MRPDLIARYADQRLPRYTSYPTAPHFGAAVGPDTYAEWLAATPAGPKGNSKGSTRKLQVQRTMPT